MLFVAVSDVHSPRWLQQYALALARRRGECREAAAVLWAGDMVLRGRVEEVARLLRVTYSLCGEDKRIIAVFGNEEFIGTEEEYRRRYGDKVTWLDDEYTIIEHDGEVVAVYGTRGSLDQLTTWQRRHMPQLARVYAERAEKLARTVKKLKAEYGKVLVLMHYAPTYKTLEGEPKRIWPMLGSLKMEKAIRESKPNVVVHGHAHRSRRLEAEIDGVKVVNVALPARWDVTPITL